jgi:hypothetical protein
MGDRSGARASRPEPPEARVEREPTAADLAAIEAEWPAIQSELDALDVALERLRCGDRGALVEWLADELDALAVALPVRRDELDWRRHRRARRRVLDVRQGGTDLRAVA